MIGLDMHLPVISNPPEGQTPNSMAEVADGLRRVLRGQVRFSRHDRMLYSTDASMYQVEPLGVLVPADTEDLRRAVEFCYEHSVAMLARGGGTSLAGQCTARAVVIDASAHCQQISDLNVPERTVYAQAGVKIDDINSFLARAGSGLFYAPDPATTAQATVGGCIGNNAAGSRSVFYGRTVDSVLAIDAVLSSGAPVRFGPGAGGRDPLALKLADGVISIVRRHETLIRERFPKTLRRNAGYALDLILQQLDAGETAQNLDLTRLLCGSEGTLAVTLGARLKLFSVPGGKGLALVSFPGVDEAIAAVQPILATHPSAVELVDDVVIEAAKGNIECSKYLRAFPPLSSPDRDPVAVLYVEYHTADPAEVSHKFAELRRVIGDAPVRLVTDSAGMADAWKLRKAGEPLLHGLPGSRKPLTFVEDNAVPVERLGEFVREFRRIVQRAGTRAAFWAHASVGVLHVRPMLDPHSPVDQATLRSIAVEVADLAQRCGGVMSGEHGDGKVRGPLLERFFGRELCGAFAQIKSLFDPKALLNPGNIVGAGSIESITQRTRIEPDVGRHPEAPPVQTFFAFADQGGFAHAVETCNGAGVCRKSSGGAMCPSYRATLDERHATRGRGNALRLAITGQLGDSNGADSDAAARFNDPATIETLNLCLSCKACKSECPSNVDMARLKAEYIAQRYRVTGHVPLAAQLTGNVRWLNRIGAVVPGLANWFNALPPSQAIIKRLMKMHPSRSVPTFSRSLYSLWNRSPASEQLGPPSTPRVVLYADCFTTYNESHIGLAARSVLAKLGYSVELPSAGCCGRSMISMGMLQQAVATIDATIELLRPAILDPGVKAIVVCEPSCLSAIRDDWLDLRLRAPLDLRKRLAEKAMLVEQFVDRYWSEHPATDVTSRAAPLSGEPVLLHAHCHQKALWGSESSAAALRRVLGDRLRVLDTGCCGMAGSFGYDRDKFDLSMKIANLTGIGEPGGGVLPHVRANRSATVLAPGTSCRHQIKDGTAGTRSALHPVELLDQLL